MPMYQVVQLATVGSWRSGMDAAMRDDLLDEASYGLLEAVVDHYDETRGAGRVGRWPTGDDLGATWFAPKGSSTRERSGVLRALVARGLVRRYEVPSVGVGGAGVMRYRITWTGCQALDIDPRPYGVTL